MADGTSEDRQSGPSPASWERPALVVALLLAACLGALAFYWRPRETSANPATTAGPTSSAPISNQAAMDARLEELRRRGARSEKFAKDRVEMALRIAETTKRKPTQVTILDLAEDLAGARFSELEKLYQEKTGKPLRDAGPFRPIIPVGGKEHPFVDGCLDAVETAAESKGLLPSTLPAAERAEAMLTFAKQYKTNK